MKEVEEVVHDIVFTRRLSVLLWMMGRRVEKGLARCVVIFLRFGS